LSGRSEHLHGVHDSWIAATCIARNLVLITANLREFGRALRPAAR